MGCLGNSKTSEDQGVDEKERREANKKIEKQLQKERLAYKATHRLLLLGKAGGCAAAPGQSRAHGPRLRGPGCGSSAPADCERAPEDVRARAGRWCVSGGGRDGHGLQPPVTAFSLCIFRGW